MRPLAALTVLIVMLGRASPFVVTAQGAETTQTATEIQALRARAQMGDPVAQADLGDAYANGRGVARDDSQAVAWYRKAANQHYAVGQYWLGLMYANGRGVPKHQGQAVAWIRKAANQGLADAQAYLGGVSGDPYTSPPSGDLSQAAAWYRKAADQGHRMAQHQLGRCYEKGWGVPQDYVEAHKWYNLSASRPAPAFLQVMYAMSRDDLAKRMTSMQIADAQQRARVWQEAFDQKKP